MLPNTHCPQVGGWRGGSRCLFVDPHIKKAEHTLACACSNARVTVPPENRIHFADILEAPCNKHGLLGISTIEVDLVGVLTHVLTIFVSSFFLINAFFGRVWAEKSDALSFPLTPGGFCNVWPRVRQVQVVGSSFLSGYVRELVPVLVASLPALEFQSLVK